MKHAHRQSVEAARVAGDPAGAVVAGGMAAAAEVTAAVVVDEVAAVGVVEIVAAEIVATAAIAGKRGYSGSFEPNNSVPHAARLLGIFFSA